MITMDPKLNRTLFSVLPLDAMSTTSSLKFCFVLETFWIDPLIIVCRGPKLMEPSVDSR